MNSVFVHTFDKSGTVHVRSLFSMAGATLHVYPLGALPCAPPPGGSRAARPGLLQIESYCAVRALPGPSRQFESCWSVRELLRSSRAAFAVGATRRRSDVRPLGSLHPRLLQLESCCAVRVLPDPSRAVRELLVSSRAAAHFESCLCSWSHTTPQ